jgi:polysaccharide biosynthesis protein PslH
MMRIGSPDFDHTQILARDVAIVRASGNQTGEVACVRRIPAGRQRVMVITPWHPEPVNNGSKIRARALVDALSACYDVVLVSIVDPQDGDPDELAQVPGVWRQYGLEQLTYRSRSVRAMSSAFSAFPRSLVATWDEHTASVIRSIAISLAIDAVVAADLRVVRYGYAAGPDVPLVIDEANLSPFIHGSGRLGSLRSRFRQQKYFNLFRELEHRDSIVIVPSRQEADAYVEVTGRSDAVVIENAIGSIPDEKWNVPTGQQLIYTGSLTYQPNLEAITYFARDILPLLATQYPDLELLVTGAEPAPSIRSLLPPRVRLTGLIPSLDRLYRASRVFIAPIQSGTGTRTKILEAMSYGMPVVSTSKGIEGLDLVAGRHLLVADSPGDFATAVSRLMQDEHLSTSLGMAARNLVWDKYCWANRRNEFPELVATLLQQTGPV